MTKVYFPGLYGLRFIAAFLIIIAHFAETARNFNLFRTDDTTLHRLTFLGELAVTFFFVLSGFLITYLLLKEKQLNGKISFKKFYTRRILRIFPLYYLIVLPGLFVFPHLAVLYYPELTDRIHVLFGAKILLFVLLLPNLAYSFIYPIPYVSHTWSIGVEEQFYLFWPLLINLFKSVLKGLLIFIAAYLLVTAALYLLADVQQIKYPWLLNVARMARLSRFDCMAIGGVYAVIYFDSRHRLLSWIYRKEVQVFAYILMALLFFSGAGEGFFEHELFAIIFGLVILDAATNEHPLLRFETPWLNYLGKISYGIYMYHLVCIRLALYVIRASQRPGAAWDIADSILLGMLSLLFTLLVAALSYRFFERPFLRIKTGYSVLSTGPVSKRIKKQRKKHPLVMEYSGESRMSWWQNKYKGMSSRLYGCMRQANWIVYKTIHPVRIDYSRLNPGSTPVIINNFNRLCSLRELVEWLLSLEDKVSVIIVDNASTYQPLLEYYNGLEHPWVQVVYLKINSWHCGIKEVARRLHGFPRFVVTDADLVSYTTTPKNVISHLSRLMDQFPAYNHVGLSLEINDIPDYNPLKEKIVAHERQFWHPAAKEINNEVMEALVDTTFAMYRGNSRIKLGLPALRTNRPYTLKHIDWYYDPTTYPFEFRYYMQACDPVATWAFEYKKISSREEA